MSNFICRVIVSTLLCLLISTSVDAQLEINEIMVSSGNDGTGPDSNEWVELINNSTSPIDISCMTISDGVFSITIPPSSPGTPYFLAPGATFLFGSAAADSLSTYGIVPNLNWATCNCAGPMGVIVQTIGSFTNSGDQLLLFDANGQPTDGVVWGGSNFASYALTTIAIPGCPATSLNFAAGVAVAETISIVTGQTNALDCHIPPNYYNDPNFTPGTLNSDQTPVPSIVTSSSNICEGESVTFNATSSILSPAGTITWSIPGISGINSNLIQTFPFPNAGSVTATLTATNSCTSTASSFPSTVSSTVTINIQELPTLTLTGSTSATAIGEYIVCIDDNIDLSATLTPAPPTTMQVSYEWTNPSTSATILSTAAAYTITNASLTDASTYEVDIIAGACTLSTAAIDVIVPNPEAQVIDDATPGFSACINEPLTIAPIIPALPTVYDLFSWTNGTVTVPNATQWNFPTNAAGTFNCQLVVTENGCDSDPLDFEVNVFDNPVVEISPLGPVDLCPDDQIILSSVNNHDSYEWFLDGVSYATSPTINVSYNLAANAYLTATDNGCTETSATVDFISHPVATLATWTPPPYALDNRLRTCLLDHPILASSNGQQFQWYLDGNPILGETSLSIIAAQDGDYYYTASTDGFCPIYSDTIAVDLEVDMTIETTASKDTACEGEIVQLIPEGEFVSYSWQGGIVADTLSVTNSGTYIVTGHLVSCSANDTVTVFFSPYPQVNAGEDFFSDCEDFTLLFGRTDGDESYWEIDGIEAGLGDTITIETPRRTSDLVLISSLNGCESRDTVNMKVDCIYIFAPTAITPDGDGLNDVFRVYANGLSSYILRIYNRFGQVVFETSNPDEVWTGGYNDYFLPNGVYTWQIEALDYNQQEALSKARSKGSIIVVR